MKAHESLLKNSDCHFHGHQLNSAFGVFNGDVIPSHG